MESMIWGNKFCIILTMEVIQLHGSIVDNVVRG